MISMKQPTVENPYQSPQEACLPEKSAVARQKKRLLAKAGGIAFFQQCGLLLVLFSLSKFMSLFIVAIIVVFTCLLNSLIIYRSLRDESPVVKRSDELVIKYAFWFFVVVAMFLAPQMSEPQDGRRVPPRRHF
jgi:amino acid transporter